MLPSQHLLWLAMCELLDQIVAMALIGTHSGHPPAALGIAMLSGQILGHVVRWPQCRAKQLTDAQKVCSAFR